MLVDRVFGELILFATIGFFIGGIDEILVDLIWIFRSLKRRIIMFRTHQRATIDSFVRPDPAGLFAVFIPVWDEAAVIGPMIAHCLKSYAGQNVRLFVGCYPNDDETLAIVGAVENQNVIRVINPKNGPTTKADCLNSLWNKLIEIERGNGINFTAVILHDAEDVVARHEVIIFDALINRLAIIYLTNATHRTSFQS